MRTPLFRLARSRVSRFFIGWIFTHMSFVIPLDRLRETETLSSHIRIIRGIGDAGQQSIVDK